MTESVTNGSSKSRSSAGSPQPIEAWRPLSELVPTPNNPRKNLHTVPMVVTSLIRFGWGRSLVVQEGTNRVVVGHTALLAAGELASYWEKADEEDGAIPREEWHPDAVLTATKGLVPVRLKPMTDRQADLYMIADNKIGEKSEWDPALLVPILDLQLGEIKVTDLGFEIGELEELKLSLEDEEPGGTAEQDVVPSLPTRARSRLGDVYLLGGNRLMCIDCRSAKWPGGIRGIWTDPPYGIDYEGGAGGVGQSKRDRIKNDDRDPKKLSELLNASIGHAADAIAAGSAIYVAAPSGEPMAVFTDVLMVKRGLARHTLVWKKDRFVLGRADYHYQHETIFYGWKPGAAHRWYGGRSLSTILEFDRPSKSEEHPTMKPVGLVAFCLKNSVRRGEIVADPFLGSGTTMIAAEQLEMITVGCELDPRYCDVIVDRWEKLTGKKATLESGSPSLKGRGGVRSAPPPPPKKKPAKESSK